MKKPPSVCRGWAPIGRGGRVGREWIVIAAIAFTRAQAKRNLLDGLTFVTLQKQQEFLDGFYFARVTVAIEEPA